MEDKMIDSLHRIDPDNLNKLLIPGFFIRAGEKERYVDVAKEMTNRTHQELHSYSSWDIVRLGKGLIQLGLSAGASTAAYRYYRGEWDIARWVVSSNNTRIIKGQDLADPYQRAAVYGVLGFISWYFLRDGMDQLAAIIDKKDRLDAHRRALQNEAIIQRIPVIDKTVCEVPRPGG
jgi:hypothetical protein